MTNTDLDRNDHDPYFDRYVQLVPADRHLREGFALGKKNVLDFFSAIPEDKWTYRYEPEKWSIKEVLQHLTDTERIFMYRAFRIGRGDITPLASFDQDIFVPAARANEKSRKDLLEEFAAVRDSSISLVNNFRDDDLKRIGTASQNAMSSRSAAFVILGHEIWHMEITKERYL